MLDARNGPIIIIRFPCDVEKKIGEHYADGSALVDCSTKEILLGKCEYLTCQLDGMLPTKSGFHRSSITPLTGVDWLPEGYVEG